jgi:hypothetical protein
MLTEQEIEDLVLKMTGGLQESVNGLSLEINDLNRQLIQQKIDSASKQNKFGGEAILKSILESPTWKKLITSHSRILTKSFEKLLKNNNLLANNVGTNASMLPLAEDSLIMKKLSKVLDRVSVGLTKLDPQSPDGKKATLKSPFLKILQWQMDQKKKESERAKKTPNSSFTGSDMKLFSTTISNSIKNLNWAQIIGGIAFNAAFGVIKMAWNLIWGTIKAGVIVFGVRDVIKSILKFHGGNIEKLLVDNGMGWVAETFKNIEKGFLVADAILKSFFESIKQTGIKIWDAFEPFRNDDNITKYGGILDKLKDTIEKGDTENLGAIYEELSDLFEENLRETFENLEKSKVFDGLMAAFNLLFEQIKPPILELFKLMGSAFMDGLVANIPILGDWYKDSKLRTERDDLMKKEILKKDEAFRLEAIEKELKILANKRYDTAKSIAKSDALPLISPSLLLPSLILKYYDKYFPKETKISGHRASGGPVSSYIVGEEGRKLFAPTGNGWIIPNQLTEHLLGNNNQSSEEIKAAFLTGSAHIIQATAAASGGVAAQVASSGANTAQALTDVCALLDGISKQLASSQSSGKMAREEYFRSNGAANLTDYRASNLVR